MKTLILLLALLPGNSLAQTSQPDAIEVMAKSRELSLTGSMKAVINMTVTEKNGSVRSRSIEMITKSFSEGCEKRFVKFLEPAEVRGTAMLIVDNKNQDDEMWIYLPALKKTRRVSSGEKGKSFMNSEFSNADMSSPALTDFTYKHLEGSGSAGTWIIESLPLNDDKASEYGYSKKISYVNSSNYYPEKMEFYSSEGKLFKVIEIKQVQSLREGRYLIKDMTAVNLVNRRSSEIIFINAGADTKIDDSVFTLQNLER